MKRQLTGVENDRRKQRFRKNGLSDLESIGEDHYFIKNNYRYVIPYTFEYRVNTKQRWFGRRILEVFSWEFPHGSANYWENELVHRHEAATTADPVEIICSDSEKVVVNKPAGLPVHPCGNYRKNSLLARLVVEHDLRNLHVVHR